MIEFFLASSNAHKALEINELLQGSGLNVLPAPNSFDVVEDGDTFQENALIKAEAYYKAFKRPALADDSGLVIPARPDIMGIYSARFAPEYSDYNGKNQRLLEELKTLKGQDREAYFVCYLCFYLGPKEIYFFEGRVHGSIAEKIQDGAGFGYDPLFLPDGEHNGRSLAQLSAWKMKNSHRAKACEAAVNFFKNQK